MNSPLM